MLQAAQRHRSQSLCTLTHICLHTTCYVPSKKARLLWLNVSLCQVVLTDVSCCGSLCISFQMRLFNLHNEAQTHSPRLNYFETTNKNECRQAAPQTYKTQSMGASRWSLSLALAMIKTASVSWNCGGWGGKPCAVATLFQWGHHTPASELQQDGRVKKRKRQSIFHMILSNKSGISLGS